MTNRKMSGGAAAILGGLLLAACGGQAGDGGNDNGRTAATAASGVRSPAQAAAKPLHLLFVGTSLTAGLGLEPEDTYPSLIAAKVDSAGLPYAVTNAGISGETSAALVARLDWLLRGDFDVIVVETGANDGLRGIPVATARQNIDSILTRVRASRPAATIVLVQMESPPNLGSAYTDAFRAMYEEMSTKHRAALMPFLLEGVAGEADLNQGDGIHPNEAGSRRVAENVWKVLGPVLRAHAVREVAGADSAR